GVMSIIERMKKRRDGGGSEKKDSVSVGVGNVEIEVKELRKEVASIEEDKSKTIEVDLIDSVRLTKRDLEILRFVNRFDYVYLEHIAEMFDLSIESRRAYQIVSRLKKLDFLKSKEVFARQPQVIFLGKKGAEILGSKQPKKINLSTFEHDINNIFVYISLTKKYPKATIKTDKELLKDSYKMGERGHRPDLIIIDDNDYIAIEVELTRKTANRLKKIKQYYLDNDEYTKVIYICNDVTYSYIKKFFDGSSFFSIVSIKENI
ncbi:hypothetical protein, partial [Francisella adeliensis]|uniref:hypothetical protein n=1 Tax=Francisella adeliensis TaxID=2007306 RepID=UPI001F409DA2